MAQTATRAVPTTYRCYRCGKEKSTSEFYLHADGSIISGCKECHREMSAARRGKATKVSTLAGLPLGIVENARPAPALVQYRCEGCGRSSMSASADGPRGWKRVRLTGGEDAATLCTRCTARVTGALQIMRAVVERRRGAQRQG